MKVIFTLHHFKKQHLQKLDFFLIAVCEEYYE